MIEIHVGKAHFMSRFLSVWIFDKDRDQYLIPVEQWKPLPPPGTEFDHAMSIHPDSAQMLMDQLWDVGVRPTQGHGSVGQLDATQRHLNDMRLLVAKKLGVELK